MLVCRGYIDLCTVAQQSLTREAPLTESKIQDLRGEAEEATTR